MAETTRGLAERLRDSAAALDAAGERERRLERQIEVRKRAVDRWVPCPDHRDKTEDGKCYVCENERLRKALRDLDLAYVNLMENGRDRIVFLGGDCDPVDVMEQKDRHLRAARRALSDHGGENGR